MLASHGIFINRKKCKLGLDQVHYLGHVVGPDGFRPDDGRVQAIRSFQVPGSKVELQRFLGMLNYYRRILPGCAGILEPLHAAVTLAGKSKMVGWNSSCQSAFEEAKSSLANATLLCHLNPFSTMALSVDASDVALGAELAQRDCLGEWKPIAFFSRRLQPTERKYSAFDRELLAIFSAIKHFRHFLEGRRFTVFTDHKPLTSALSSSTDRSLRHTRHLSFIAEFTSDIQHVAGKMNVVADALSRPSPDPDPVAKVTAIDFFPSSVNFKSLAEAQRRLPPSPDSSSLQLEAVPWRGVDMLCDISTGRLRPLVPPEFRFTIFSAIHDLSHPGPRPSHRLVSSRFVWPNMKKDIKEFCRNCHPCQAAKIARHVSAPVVKFAPAERRFGSLHVDLVGPLPPSEGYRYLFTMVNRFSRWPEAVPLADASAISCCRAFIHTWTSPFGVPDDVVTDRGAQFTGQWWRELMEHLGISHHTTTAFHPQSNGLVERMHRQMKGALKARLDSDPEWMDQLPWVMLGLRAAWREGTDSSSAESLYGTTLRLPGQFIPGTESPPTSQDAFLAELQKKMHSLSSFPSDHHS